jgi:hypothetical protein
MYWVRDRFPEPSMLLLCLRLFDRAMLFVDVCLFVRGGVDGESSGHLVLALAAFEFFGCLFE